MLSHYQMKEIPYLRILGRTNGSLEPVTLFWTASGIELNVKATEIWVKIRSDYDVFEPWVDVIVDGVLSQPKLRLEVIGDSITSGEGGSGAGEEMTWNSFCFNAVDNYAYMAAKELGAVYNCISQSGWGVFCSWEGNEQQAIPLYYEQVCGLLNGERNKQLGAMEKWDFQKFQPDVIVVNLGTNDSSGTKNMDRVGKAVEDFLRKLRVCNPESYILWCYGMLGDEILPTLEKAVGNYKRKTGDERVEFVKLPDTQEGEFGSRQHPGHRSHERTAKILVEKIQEKMTLLVTP